MTNNLVTAAGTVRAVHLDALGPLAAIAAHTTDAPPSIEDGLHAVVHLTAAQPQLDAAVTDLYRELLAAGVPAATLARLLAMRTRALTDRLASPAPAEVAVPEVQPGAFKLRDCMSQRAARETLITAAGDLGGVYADALRPLSAVSQGTVPEAAVTDTTVEAAMHLRRARRDLQGAVDAVLAALVLGGVKRTALSELLGINAATLQRRLLAHPLANARGCDLVTDGDGGWRVERAAVGRYAPRVLDEAVVQRAIDDAVKAAVG
ncbi:hypothetical protein [Mycobacterium sp. D16Q16]|uniref:hypothetical protein n=1 Tax=Mycobacterium sp. D16Q16 TaxID=1855659 RepID=UPI00099219E4|nr:hypothetical protein [Mycobacterium sp. D16Q16]